MKPRLEHLDAELTSMAFFETLPWADRTRINFANVRGVQFMQPCSSSRARALAAARHRI
jgi:pyruvate-ferredoxin/flavodoxin oxidoreductase